MAWLWKGPGGPALSSSSSPVLSSQGVSGREHCPSWAVEGARSELLDTHLQSGHFHWPVVLSNQEKLHRDGLLLCAPRCP